MTIKESDEHIADELFQETQTDTEIYLNFELKKSEKGINEVTTIKSEEERTKEVKQSLIAAAEEVARTTISNAMSSMFSSLQQEEVFCNATFKNSSVYIFIEAEAISITLRRYLMTARTLSDQEIRLRKESKNETIVVVIEEKKVRTRYYTRIVEKSFKVVRGSDIEKYKNRIYKNHGEITRLTESEKLIGVESERPIYPKKLKDVTITIEEAFVSRRDNTEEITVYIIVSKDTASDQILAMVYKTNVIYHKMVVDVTGVKSEKMTHTWFRTEDRDSVYRAPVFVEPFRLLRKAAGFIELKCQVSGYPLPRVRVLRNGHAILRDDRYYQLCFLTPV